MKRSAAILFAALMLISTTVSADEISDFWAAAGDKLYSGEFEISIQIQPTQVPEVFGGNIGPIDLQYDVKFDASADYHQMRVEANLDISAPDIGVEQSDLHIWTDMDIAETGEANVLAIVKTPDSDKYTVGGDSSQVIPLGWLQNMDEKQAEVLEVYKKYAVVSYENGEYNVSLSKEAASGLLSELMGSIAEYMDQQATGIVAAVANLDLFAEDAISSTIVLDDSKKIKSSEAIINIDTNLLSVMQEMSPGMAEMIGLTAENSQLTATVLLNIDIVSYNQPVSIEFPLLTVDNVAIPYGSELPASIELPPGVTASDGDGEVDFGEAQPFIQSNIAYLPLRQTMNTVGVPDESVIWHGDGTITVDVYGDPFLLTIGQDSVLNGEAEYLLDAPVLLVGDYTFVPMEFLDVITCDYESFERYNGDEIASVYISLYSEFIPDPTFDIAIPE